MYIIYSQHVSGVSIAVPTADNRGFGGKFPDASKSSEVWYISSCRRETAVYKLLFVYGTLKRIEVIFSVYLYARKIVSSSLAVFTPHRRILDQTVFAVFA